MGSIGKENFTRAHTSHYYKRTYPKSSGERPAILEVTGLKLDLRIWIYGRPTDD